MQHSFKLSYTCSTNTEIGKLSPRVQYASKRKYALFIATIEQAARYTGMGGAWRGVVEWEGWRVIAGECVGHGTHSPSASAGAATFCHTRLQFFRLYILNTMRSIFQSIFQYWVLSLY